MILCASPGEQYQAHQSGIDAAIARVLKSGWYVLGQEVTAFEKEFAQYQGVDFALGVGSGTEALHLALSALDIGAGDEVITVSHTAVATVSAIQMTGAQAVLVDIEPGYFTIDPQAFASSITSRTKAVVVVHLYGQAANLDEILAIAKKHGIKVIEDCAQATGTWIGDRRAGSTGDFGCFSFYPTKNLGAIGDGGAVITHDEKLAKKVALLRQYGWENRYVSKIHGWNSRLDELQAAILRVKLPALDRDNQKRTQIAELYTAGLKGLQCQLPPLREQVKHTYHLYVVQTPQRDALQSHLKDQGVQTMIHYPMPIHMQPGYAEKIRVGGSMRVTEKAAAEVLSLPMYPELSMEQADRVIQAMRSFKWA